MSITYGHFSGALHSTASSGYANSTTLYFTIPWYPVSYVDRIRVFNTTGNTANISSIAIMNNAAHTRFGDGYIVEDYVYFDDTSATGTVKAASNYSAYYAIDPPIHVEEEYNRPYLYVKVIVASISDDIYYVTAIGRKSIGTERKLNDSTGIVTDKNYSVVLLKNSNNGVGNTIFDVTMPAISNSYLYDNENNFSIGSTRDYVYIGATQKVDHWDFQASTASTNCGALIGEIWNGSAWSNFKVLDNTSSDGTNSLRFSGVVEGAGLGSSTWATTILNSTLSASLPTDPATGIGISINNGLTYPLGFFVNPPRYWARFHVDSIGDKVVFKAILPIEENYT